MRDRWSREQVLGLAPDAASAKAAGGVAKPAKWARTGCDDEAVWGDCQGSGKSVYRTCADLTGPAFRCTCPSRKFPCKHALALLLLWADGLIPAPPASDTAQVGVRPGWVAEWMEDRQERAGRTAGRRAASAAKARDPRTVERRARRVDDGLAELDQWLRDQVAHGLAQAEKAPYRLWDDAARRLVDAQAGALAGQVRGLAAIPRRPGWPGRLLEEYALLRLLVRAYQRQEELPEGLRATVRSRVGFTVPQEDVLSGGERVRDVWSVTGSRDTAQELLTTRRVWLRGSRTGRPALVLSFAAPGTTLDTSLVVGTQVDAELAFYPGAQPLRALVAERHGAAVPGTPAGTSVRGFLDEHAAAVALDPWLDRWPATLERVRLARTEGGELHVVDDAGDALPLRIGEPWRLLALSGGGPVTLAGEWRPLGLRPLAAWHEDEGTVIL
ncbi:SWIM zinc finger family protein [Actinomadura sp. K4S16]|uniref:SWIM zinc finger family protein n=1 Tax=Actinomadura sp. K4S16 TaxID=1316147 RepID=UPI0011EBB440|nr:SWIM zinc finger family protein [Actinomadura sp. K4S16]